MEHISLVTTYRNKPSAISYGIFSAFLCSKMLFKSRGSSCAWAFLIKLKTVWQVQRGETAPLNSSGSFLSVSVQKMNALQRPVCLAVLHCNRLMDRDTLFVPIKNQACSLPHPTILSCNVKQNTSKYIVVRFADC